MRLRRAALAVLGAAALTGGARRAATLAAVPPALRTPDLWVPLSVGSRLELAAARRIYRTSSEPVPGVDITPVPVPGGREVFVYEPAGRRRPSGALLWIHGGGMILGHPEGDHDLCSRIARDLGILVVSARYRLAPEHPFPAGLDDCFAALRWLAGSAGTLGVDAARIAVGGGSAGGGLAAAVAQRAHDEAVALRVQLLLYPMLDDRTVLRSDVGGRGRITWTPRSNAYAWTCYLGRPPGAVEPPPYAAPARRADLSGLAPAWIGVGDLDLFHDEDIEYARRLAEDGVPVAVRVEPGLYHAAERDLWAGVPAARAFQRAMFDALAEAVADHVADDMADDVADAPA